LDVNFFRRGWSFENVVPSSRSYSLLLDSGTNKQSKRDSDVLVEITSIERKIDVISSGLTDVLHRADSLLEKQGGNKNG
jgi:hypothetical protein